MNNNNNNIFGINLDANNQTNNNYNLSNESVQNFQNLQQFEPHKDLNTGSNTAVQSIDNQLNQTVQNNLNATPVGAPINSSTSISLNELDNSQQINSQPSQQPGMQMGILGPQPEPIIQQPSQQPGMQMGILGPQPEPIIQQQNQQPGVQVGILGSQPEPIIQQPSQQPGVQMGIPSSQPESIIQQQNQQPVMQMGIPSSQPESIIQQPSQQPGMQMGILGPQPELIIQQQNQQPGVQMGIPGLQPEPITPQQNQQPEVTQLADSLDASQQSTVISKKKKINIKLILIIIGAILLVGTLIFFGVLFIKKLKTKDNTPISSETICSLEKEENGMMVSEQFLFDYDNETNELFSIEKSKDVTYNDESQKEAAKSILDQESQKMEENGIVSDLLEYENTYSIMYNIDVSTFNTIFPEYDISSKNNVKKVFTSKGYTCE